METVRINDPRYGKFSDSEVIERVIKGEKELFEVILRRYNQTLYRIVRGYLKDDEEIEDAMQESYLKAYENLASFKGASAFSTWLIRIAINEALNRLRRKGKYVSINSHGVWNEMQNQLSRAVKQSNPESRVIQNEMKNILEISIDKLPDKYRAVYLMREVEGMSYDNICNCLDLTETNVKVRFHRAP